MDVDTQYEDRIIEKMKEARAEITEEYLALAASLNIISDMLTNRSYNVIKIREFIRYTGTQLINLAQSADDVLAGRDYPNYHEDILRHGQ